MSGKKARQDRKLSIMTEEADPKQVAKGMAESIEKMVSDRDEKVKAAREHLKGQLEVTVEKYLTANGVMSALQTVCMVLGERSTLEMGDKLVIAKNSASRMSEVVKAMIEKLDEMATEDLGSLCDGFYMKDFSHSHASMFEMVDELMSLQLCQNVGPDAGDIVDFLNTANEEIEKARENLATFCKENGISLDGDNLCAKDCKDDKLIEDGQSAYDVCEGFVEQE